MTTNKSRSELIFELKNLRLINALKDQQIYKLNTEIIDALASRLKLYSGSANFINQMLDDDPNFATFLRESQTDISKFLNDLAAQIDAQKKTNNTTKGN
jgi:hypothetical protein